MLKEFILSFIATLFFAIFLNCPKKSIAPVCFLAAFAYIIFSFSQNIYTPVASYFISTFFIAALSEILARIFKMPATIFLIPAIIPLVPGMGIYETMINLVAQNFEIAASKATQTIVNLSAIAISIVIVLIFTKILTTIYLFLKKEYKNHMRTR